MSSKILFRNETTYTLEIAEEAGAAFWKVQPAYRKRAKKIKIIAGIISLTFLITAVIAIVKQGFGIMCCAALAMGIIAGVAMIKAESMIKGSVKNFSGLDTKVDYGVSENFFFVLNRADLKKAAQAVDDGGDESPALVEDIEVSEDDKEAEKIEDSNALEVIGADDDDIEGADDESSEEGEILALDELLACIETPKIFILIWAEPYFILDKDGFAEDKVREFKDFISERVDIIEA